MDFSSMTVIELRKYAREHGVTLSAGINKEGIIARLQEAEEGSPSASAPEQLEIPRQPAEPTPRPEAQQTVFRPAWHNPSNRYNTDRTFGGGRSTFASQRAAQQPERPSFRTAPRSEGEPAQPAQRSGYTPRFGPGASSQPARTEERTTSWREPAFRPAAPAPAPAPGQAPAYAAPAQPEAAAPAPRAPQSSPVSTLAPEDMKPAAGFVEMHPDGYAFLRVNGLLASPADIYVAPAQIRRFGLRAGDYVEGKVRPIREGDKFAALLTVSSVNGNDPDRSVDRPAFDSLTAVYPTRRLSIELKDPKRPLTRFVDAVAPMGFGQRALLLCQPEAGKTSLLRDLANAISENHPDAKVFIVLLDAAPEDVTLLRDQVKCPVYATTFDQSPDNHLRLTDLALERAERLVELGQDVVLLVDSLTKLSKTYTLAAAQQGRATPGTINPTSLYRARKLLGAARALRSGGSLTVFGCLNTATGNRVDDTIIEEFREASNSVVTLDASLAKAGISPSVSWHQSGTHRCGLFLDESRKEGMRLLRQELDPLSDAAIVRQLLDLFAMTPDNAALFSRVPDMVKLMRGSK